LEPVPTPAIEPGRLYRLAWTVYLVMALGGVLWIGLRQGSIPLALFLDARRWWLDLLLGVAAGALLLVSWHLAARWLPLARRLEEQLGALLGPIRPAEVFALALLSGFAEELFFRGAVQGSWGWAVATILFAVLHSGPGPSFRFWTLFALAAGALFGGLMVWRGNLLGPIAGHFLVNAVNLRRLARRAGDSARLGPPGEQPRGTTEGENRGEKEI
jgi:membrane protease YdiL (CAAX protease family)